VGGEGISSSCRAAVGEETAGEPSASGRVTVMLGRVSGSPTWLEVALWILALMGVCDVALEVLGQLAGVLGVLAILSTGSLKGDASSF